MNKLHLLPAGIVAALLLAACASIGHPDGGPRDTEPPVYVGSRPLPGSLNVSSKKITIFFDENVSLDDPANKIAISPTQKTNPQITANGRRVDIELQDSLLPNTTYTIDLADAVKDLNEGNPMDGLAIDFSTGDSIDTLSISGMVLEARNLEPAQGMIVGVYASPEDSMITTSRFSRIARTNQLGQFTVRNLPPGSYQIFALNDLNRDYHWDRSEDVGFYNAMISPRVEIEHRTDTAGVDSTIITNLPNDILLTWFNENYTAQYLKDYGRRERGKININMAAPPDSLPQLNIVTIGGKNNLRIPMEDVSVMTRNAAADSLMFWITDSAITAADTLLIETRYRRVDTLENLVWQTDTLKFNIRSRKEKNPYKPLTLQEKIDSVLAISDTIVVDTFALMQPKTFVDLNIKETTQELNEPAFITARQPLKNFDVSAMRLEMTMDSVWQPVEPQPEITMTDSLGKMELSFNPKWTPGARYQLTVDTMAVYDIYNNYNKTTKLEFTARKLEDYSTINLSISGVPDSAQAIVELLNGSDEPIRSVEVRNGGVVLDYLLPATYYLRLFIDSDRNGEWTNGDLRKRRQPEDVYYFPKKLTLKKNWDRNESWDINALSADMQKPDDIKKNKPKPKPGELNNQPQNEEEEEEDDGFGTNHFSNNRNNEQF